MKPKTFIWMWLALSKFRLDFFCLPQSSKLRSVKQREKKWEKKKYFDASFHRKSGRLSTKHKQNPPKSRLMMCGDRRTQFVPGQIAFMHLSSRAMEMSLMSWITDINFCCAQNKNTRNVIKNSQLRLSVADDWKVCNIFSAQALKMINKIELSVARNYQTLLQLFIIILLCFAYMCQFYGCRQESRKTKRKKKIQFHG